MISRSNDDDDDLREYDVSCAVRLAMGPDPIAILAGHQGLSLMEERKCSSKEFTDSGTWQERRVILVAINWVHQRALCSSLCLGIDASTVSANKPNKMRIVPVGFIPNLLNHTCSVILNASC